MKCTPLGSHLLLCEMPKSQLREELWNFLKKVRALKLDANLTSLILPASRMLPFSATELLLLALSHKAAGLAAAAHEGDKCRRMLRVLGAELAGMSHTLTAPMKKPYNPVLGELLVAARAEKPAEAGSGGGSAACRVVLEQVSHHPPLTAFHVEGTDFRHCGSSAAEPLFRGNSVEVRIVTLQPCRTVLRLEDGTEEEFRTKSFPSMCLRNIFGIGRLFCEWVGELEVECDECVGRLVFHPAKLFNAASAHRVTGSISVGGDKNASTPIYQISGAWTGRVVATATRDGDELELLPALPGGVDRPTSLASMPRPPPFELPPHSLDWERHSQRVWSELTAALREQNWVAARAAKHSVEQEMRAEAAAMAEAGSMWAPALFEAADPAGPAAGAWLLRDGALDRAFDPDAEQPCQPIRSRS